MTHPLSRIAGSALAGAVCLATATTAWAQQTYTTNADFAAGAKVSVNDTAPNIDQLQLNSSSETEPFIWVANTDYNTVTKINTRTGKQVAKYVSVLHSAALSAAGVPDPATVNTNYPSRTAVDGDGNAFVSNRAFNYRPSLTKFAGTIGSCVDRNNNGTIETSTDVDGDGLIEDGLAFPAVAGEYLGQADECILWTVETLTHNDLGRSAAVDANGDVWVAGFYSNKLEKRSGVNGALLESIDPNAITGTASSTYGLAIGPGGMIYTADISYNRLRMIDPATSTVNELVAPSATYGLAIDRDGVTWQGAWSNSQSCNMWGWSCTSSPHYIVKADFAAGITAKVNSDGSCTGYTRGVAIDGDGTIWASCWQGNRLLKFSPTGVFQASYPTASGPIGVAIDGDGNIWTANQTSNTVSKYDKNDPTSRQDFNAGGPPYSYSDMTGFQQRNITSRQGTWTVIQDGSNPGTPWGTVSWNAEGQGSTPSGSEITAQVRAADTVADLGAQPFVEVTNGDLFGGVNGRYIEVKMTLRLLDISSGNGPILSDVTIAPANRAPLAICQDVTVNTDPGVCTASASIDAGSNDPDPGQTITSSQVPTMFGLGTTGAQLTVTDPFGLQASCSANVTVVDNQPPAIMCPAPTTIECAGPQTMFTPAAASATDNCSATVSNPAAGMFGLGTHVLNYSATDGSASASCTSQVTIVDTTKPVIAAVTNNVNSIWPPNHAMIPVTVSVTATDSCGGGAMPANACRITNITSNEAVNSTGDGNTDPDWIVPANGLTASLRAERKGNGTGRIYTITVECSDGFNTTTGTTTVAVPHSQRGR